MSFKKTRVDICIGAGGVGKTTAASIIALNHALRGEKTLVITLDPAKRLLDALGLSKRYLAPKRLDLTEVMGAQTPGELYVFMPDLKKEWMDFLNTAIPKREVRHEISSNHFYQYMAEGLPGSFEIICAHVLFRLMDLGQYDRIVLDTPPSSHSLSFFDVPKKLAAVLEQNIFRLLMNKRNSMLLKFTKKLAFFSGGLMEKTLERLMGSHFLSEVIDFSLTIDSLYEPMLKRAQAMEALLKNEETRYILVLSPTSASISDSFYLQDALKKRGIKIDEVILNQVTKKLPLQALTDEKALINDASVVKLIEMYEDAVANEKHLLAKLNQFLPVSHVLYEQEGLDRQSLLRTLLADYNRN